MTSVPVEFDLEAPWPSDGLETLDRCPLCRAADLHPLHTGLRDKSFYSSPGVWTLDQCARCKVAILNPRPSRETIHLAYRNYYTHSDSAPDQRGPPSTWQKMRNDYLRHRFGVQGLNTKRLGNLVVRLVPGARAELNSLYRYLPPPTVERRHVLDVGCGDGSWLALAQAAGWEACGADPDPAARALAYSRGVDVRDGGIEAWADRPNSFEAIVMSHVIEHVHNPLEVIVMAFKLLRPGGLLFIDTPNLNALGHAKYGPHWRGLEPPRHLVIFNNSALKRALVQAGFSRVRSVPRPQPFFLLSIVSACIAQGRPYSDEVDQSGLQLPTRIERLRARLTRRHREFLTVTALKPRR